MKCKVGNAFGHATYACTEHEKKVWVLKNRGHQHKGEKQRVIKWVGFESEDKLMESKVGEFDKVIKKPLGAFIRCR